MRTLKLADAVTTTGVKGSASNIIDGMQDTDARTFQATVSGTGAVTSTVLIQVSNDGTNYITAGTITLSGTTSATDGFVLDAPWAYVRANVTAISGTSAAVTVTMAY